MILCRHLLLVGMYYNANTELWSYFWRAKWSEHAQYEVLPNICPTILGQFSNSSPRTVGAVPENCDGMMILWWHLVILWWYCDTMPILWGHLRICWWYLDGIMMMLWRCLGRVLLFFDDISLILRHVAIVGRYCDAIITWQSDLRVLSAGCCLAFPQHFSDSSPTVLRELSGQCRRTVTALRCYGDISWWYDGSGDMVAAFP